MMNTCISALSACRPEFFLVGVRSLHMGYPIGAALRVLRLRFRMNRMKWLRWNCSPIRYPQPQPHMMRTVATAVGYFTV